MNTSINESSNNGFNFETYNTEEITQHLEPILKLATEICGVPFSLVNLSGKNGQKTLASYGRWDNQQISNVQKICGKLGSDQNIEIINNIREHPEIKTTLSKRDLDTVSFYAGAPLKSKSGSRVGALCLFDSESRDLTESQKECFRTLADETVLKLQNYRLNDCLKEKNRVIEKQSILLKNSADITFVVQPESGKIIDVNNDVGQTLGYSPESLLQTYFVNLVDREDDSTNAADDWFSPENKIDGRYSVHLRLKDKQNEKRWFECIFTRDSDYWYCSARDINQQKEAESGVYELKEKFQKVVKVSTDLVYELNWESKSLSWGDELTDILGYPNEERFVDYDWWLDKIHPEDLERVIHDVSSTVEGEAEKVKLVYRIRTFEGSYKYVMNHKFIDRKEDGTPDKIIGAIVDISDLKEAEDQAERHQKLLEELAGHASAAIWIRDDKGKHQYMNQNFRSLFDLGEASVVGKTVHELFDEDKANQFHENDQKVLKSGDSHLFDESIETKMGKRFYKTNIFPINEDKLGGVSIDITEEIEAQENLKKTVEEKEILLKEIHHRVKNNLAIVSGMLHLQWYKEGDKRVKEKLLDSTSRIKTMATIHEILYQSLSFTNLKMDKNIRRLIDGITASYGVTVDLDTTFNLEPIVLNINQAILFSLIINEAVTNVYKHAYGEGESGTITVTLFEKNGKVTLTIEDDGKGLADDFDPKGTEQTLGLELIETLAKQLKAEYSFISLDKGAQFKLTFEKEDGKGAGSSIEEE